MTGGVKPAIAMRRPKVGGMLWRWLGGAMAAWAMATPAATRTEAQNAAFASIDPAGTDENELGGNPMISDDPFTHRRPPNAARARLTNGRGRAGQGRTASVAEGGASMFRPANVRNWWRHGAAALSAVLGLTGRGRAPNRCTRSSTVSRLRCGVVLAIALGLASEGHAAEAIRQSNVGKEIFVAMRDGVNLSTDVYLPERVKGRFPTILIRTPYPFEKAERQYLWDYWLQHGYAVVVQSQRGTYFSEGYYSNALGESPQGSGLDGLDAVDWIVKQGWSNGKVGTLGCSASGETQWTLAAQNHPGHVAMVPAGTWLIGDIPGNDTKGLFYRGGVPWSGPWASWYDEQRVGERPVFPPNTTQDQRVRIRNSYSLARTRKLPDVAPGVIPPEYMRLPSQDLVRQGGGAQTLFEEYITWTPGDPRWKNWLIDARLHPRVPALVQSTWYDAGVTETVRWFKHLQDQGIPNQYLIVGPGPHCSFSRPTWQNFGNLKFGDVEPMDARYGGLDDGYRDLYLRWFDFWTKGEHNKVLDMPKVQVFVQGKGWVTGDVWPLPQTRSVTYFLDDQRNAATSSRAGALIPSPPTKEARQQYLYDPANPVPSVGSPGMGSAAVALDQRLVEARNDVLTYTTARLEKPLTVLGQVEVELYVSSSAKDTDFMVKLIDVYPDGKAINLSEDAFRVRYRDGYDKEAVMKPGEVYKIRLTNMMASIHIPKGHHIRLDVTSSNFPTFERNLNTGGSNYDETKWVVAENVVHHGPRRPSRITLPTIPE